MNAFSPSQIGAMSSSLHVCPIAARRLWAQVALVAVDDAIDDVRKFSMEYACADIERWSRSKDGCEVLRLAGIEPCERVTNALIALVEAGVKTSRLFSEERPDDQKSAVKGVYCDRRTGKWRASLPNGRGAKHLGTFKDRQSAENAVIAAGGGA